MSIELILLAVNINLISFSIFTGDITGQIFTMLILTVAAAEAAIGLAIIVILQEQRFNKSGRYSSDERINGIRGIIFAIIGSLIGYIGRSFQNIFSNYYLFFVSISAILSMACFGMVFKMIVMEIIKFLNGYLRQFSSQLVN